MMNLMCRIVGYVGGGRALRTLIDDAPHGLERQSWAPREMQGAVVNADGWGCAWYLPTEPEPCVYRSPLPIWADANRFGLGRTVSSACLMAAVRSATDPLSHSLANTQPFVHGPLCFLHNGYVKPFRESIQRRLRRTLSDEAYRCVRGETDSEHFFGLVVDEWLRAEKAEQRVVRALQRATERLLSFAEEAGGIALVAAALAEGPRTVAVQRLALGGTPPSLYVRELGDGSVFASEPLDVEAGWTSVDPGAPRLLSPGTS